MHELGIAHSIAEQVCEAANEANASRIDVVHLRVGVLSGVAIEPLCGCWEIVTHETIAKNSKLICCQVDASIYCRGCAHVVTVAECWRLCCPTCGVFSNDLRTGRELEIVSLECS